MLYIFVFLSGLKYSLLELIYLKNTHFYHSTWSHNNSLHLNIKYLKVYLLAFNNILQLNVSLKFSHQGKSELHQIFFITVPLLLEWSHTDKFILHRELLSAGIHSNSEIISLAIKPEWKVIYSICAWNVNLTINTRQIQDVLGVIYHLPGYLLLWQLFKPVIYFLHFQNSLIPEF